MIMEEEHDDVGLVSAPARCALRGVGFQIESVMERNISAQVDEWCEFLCAYRDAVLGLGL